MSKKEIENILYSRTQLEIWDSEFACKRLQDRWGSYQSFYKKPGKRIIGEAIIPYLQKKPNQKVLEVGCGTGHFLWYFRRFCGEMTGLDYSKNMLKLCSEQFRNNDPAYKIDFKRGSCWELPFENNTFDTSYQIDVCMHIGGSWDSILEMIRVSKKYVIFTGPSFDNFPEEEKNVFEKRVTKRAWSINTDVLIHNLDDLINERKIKSYSFKNRPDSVRYQHRILVIEKENE